MKTPVRLYLYASLSIVLLSLPWLGFSGYFLFAAFVPLLMIGDDLRDKKSKKGKPIAFWPWYTGVFICWNLLTIFWVRHATLGGGIFAVFVDTWVASFPFAVYSYLRRRSSPALAFTALVAGWIGYEYIFMNGQFSFPWLTLGNGFANTVKAVQWYEYTGIFGGSLWVWIVNLSLHRIISLPKPERRPKKWLAPALWILLPLTISLTIYYRYEEKTDPVTIQVLQPNIDPYHEKFGTLSFREQTSILLRLADQAPMETDYFLAPETAIEDRIWENEIADNYTVNRIREFLISRYPNSVFLTGASTFLRYDTEEEASITARSSLAGYWYDVYNTALLIDTTGTIGIHHKGKLVAGAEMIPYYGTLRFLNRFALDLGGIMGQLGPAGDPLPLQTASGELSGVAICYESIYGEYVTEYVKKGAEILFIITNDGWWKNTPGYRQHFSFARLRCIETRRSLARSANTGISGFIDQRGDIQAQTRWEERVSIHGSINRNDTVTFYVRWGDIVGRISCFVFVLCILAYIADRRRKKDTLPGK